MRTGGRDSTILPLIDSGATNWPRRQRRWQFADILRFVFRRRFKFYIFASILLAIMILTIVHRRTLKYDHTQHHNNDHQAAPKARRQDRFEPAQTMRTIVGKYVGPKPEWEYNISAEILNTNSYDPSTEMGRDGRPVYLPGYPKDRMQMLYSINRFNLAVSDKIPVDRKLPDPRKSACRQKSYDDLSNVTTSIIIIFHNEAWSVLMRTVHSVLNTAPHHLLAEILLVDDCSNRTFLGQTLENYINNLSSVRSVDIKLIRSRERVGLIRGRLLGVEHAKGQILTFLDAHCETTKGWLEPLLHEVKSNPKTAACPVLDIINQDTFAFARSFELHFGAFNFGLNFRWYPISKRELVATNGMKNAAGKVKFNELVNPFSSPTMAGGIFAISNEYFHQIGQYDSGMDIWGGENIELSFRLWMCGGQVKILPCSHVAHVFRKSSPYTFRPGKEIGDVLYTNLARVAEVWMDDWREFFYLMNPIVAKTLTKVGLETAFAGLEARKRLRSELKCNDFAWFLRQIWPENFFPSHERFFGRIKQESSQDCLQRPLVKSGSGSVPVGAGSMNECSSKVPLKLNQLFVFDQKANSIMTDENVCLDSGSDPIPTRQVIFTPCTESQRQKWLHNEHSQLVHAQSGLCLEAPNRSRIQLASCEPMTKTSLKWSFVAEKWH